MRLEFWDEVHAKTSSLFIPVMTQPDLRRRSTGRGGRTDVGRGRRIMSRNRQFRQTLRQSASCLIHSNASATASGHASGCGVQLFHGHLLSWQLLFPQHRHIRNYTYVSWPYTSVVQICELTHITCMWLTWPIYTTVFITDKITFIQKN